MHLSSQIPVISVSTTHIHSAPPWHWQEDDPLDAFMADLNNLDKQPAAPAVPLPDKKRKADVGLDEEADNVADFLEVHLLHAINALPG